MRKNRKFFNAEREQKFVDAVKERGLRLCVAVVVAALFVSAVGGATVGWVLHAPDPAPKRPTVDYDRLNAMLVQRELDDVVCGDGGRPIISVLRSLEEDVATVDCKYQQYDVQLSFVAAADGGFVLTLDHLSEDDLVGSILTLYGTPENYCRWFEIHTDGRLHWQRGVWRDVVRRIADAWFNHHDSREKLTDELDSLYEQVGNEMVSRNPARGRELEELIRQLDQRAVC